MSRASSDHSPTASPSNASGSRKRRSEHMLGHDHWEDFFDIEWFLDRAAVQDYLCSVCGYVVKEATETVCGHVFCLRCIRQALEVKRECPMCRRSLPYYTGAGATVHPSQITDRVVGRQMVRCVNHDGGCAWKGCFSDLKRHMADCTEHYIPCPNAALGCAERFPRRRSEHHTARCEYALIPCPKECGTQVPRGQMDKHIADECPNVRVDCPHGCPVRSMLRAELHSHLSSFCPLEIVSCPFYDAGCSVMLQRGLLEGHLSETSKEHLDGALSALQEAKQEISRLSNEVGSMKAEKKKSGGFLSGLFGGMCRSNRR